LITFQHAKDKDKIIQFGLKDPRRLARLRLVAGEDPLLEDPINKLGFDPVLNLPTAEMFNKMVLKRAVPVKALLLDQSFSAGVGNWVADEILYQSRIHPAQYTNTLNEDELTELYNKLKFVCETAVSAEADESKLPHDWLMKYRWGKGKKRKQMLPNGLALQFETVGGRTSAFVPSRQKLRKSATATVVKKVIFKKEKKVVDAGVKKEKRNKKKVTSTSSTTTSTIVAKEEGEDEENELIALSEEIKTRVRVSSRYNFRQK
jgi:formamidopyrimidine-DNA glycosylase